jgi:hypothetical protein
MKEIVRMKLTAQFMEGRFQPWQVQIQTLSQTEELKVIDSRGQRLYPATSRTKMLGRADTLATRPAPN